MKNQTNIATETKLTAEPAVVAHLHTSGNEGHVDWSAINGIISRITVANGEVVSFKQITSDKETELPIFPKTGAGLGKWL